MSKYRIREERFYDGSSAFYPEQKHWFFWFKIVGLYDIRISFSSLEAAQDFIKARIFHDKENPTFHKVEETNE